MNEIGNGKIIGHKNLDREIKEISLMAD